MFPSQLNFLQQQELLQCQVCRPPAQPTQATTGPNANPLDLFPQGLPDMGANAHAGNLDFLCNSPRLQALRATMQANPQMGRSHRWQHILKLNIGAPVMCMRNIDQQAGLCNGTRLQILRMGINIIEGKIISGGKVGTVCGIPRMVISPSDNKMPFKLNRRQFLFRSAFL